MGAAGQRLSQLQQVRVDTFVPRPFQHLPPPPSCAGDGAGVGKGRQISGVILDNYARGRRCAQCRLPCKTSSSVHRPHSHVCGVRGPVRTEHAFASSSIQWYVFASSWPLPQLIGSIAGLNDAPAPSLSRSSTPHVRRHHPLPQSHAFVGSNSRWATSPTT